MSRVLFVEDYESHRKLCVNHFRMFGHDVEEGENELEAIEQLRTKRRFDAVYTDMAMKKPDGGLKVLEHILTKGLQIPVYVVSGDKSVAKHLRAAASRGAKKIFDKEDDNYLDNLIKELPDSSYRVKMKDVKSAITWGDYVALIVVMLLAAAGIYVAATTALQAMVDVVLFGFLLFSSVVIATELCLGLYLDAKRRR